MSRFDDAAMKKLVYTRDNFSCRWCGVTNQGPYDVHHIKLRRSSSDDRPDNLITLCRRCHDAVHTWPGGYHDVCEPVLRDLVKTININKTGLSLLRHKVTTGEFQPTIKRMFP